MTDNAEQYRLGLQCGQNDASENRPFTLRPCSAAFEAGYRQGYQSVAEFMAAQLH